MTRASDADSVLVVGPSWVGDMVMAQALFILLKARKPDIAIDVLAPAWSLPIVARMPEVRRGIAAETGHGELGLGKRRRIGYALRDAGYEHAIVLPRSLKSALIPWFARIPRRTGFRGESRYGLVNDMRPFDKAVLDQTVKRFVALGLDAGEALPEAPLWTPVAVIVTVPPLLNTAPPRPSVKLLPSALLSITSVPML